MSNRHNRQISSLAAARMRASIPITAEDVYSYALRAAYLHYLLQPRPRLRVEAPIRTANRTSTNISELIRDLTPSSSNAKTTRFPKEMLPLLSTRLEAVWMGRESGREYQDQLVKRTFAAFYTAFKEKSFYRQIKDSRRAEDLVLIFFSSATKEMQKQKADGSSAGGEVKWIVDMHLALFVRLLSSTLKSGGWSSSHSDLLKKLNELETRLLRHDQNLAEGVATGTGRSSTPSMLGPIAPPSTDINDMPMVKTVAKVFDLPPEMVQADILKNKDVWTEKAALQDFKAYSYHLNLDTPRTLRRVDFSSDEAYDLWKKHETSELGKLILVIMQSNPTELARMSTSTARTSFYGDHSRNYSITSTNTLGSAISEDSEATFHSVDDSDDVPYTFFPPDGRGYYKLLMKKCIMHSISEPEAGAEDDVAFFSKASQELLNECFVRWRIHPTSRVVLLLDAICDLYKESRLRLEHVDAGFQAFKAQVEENFELWPTVDRELHIKVLREFHDTLLRELYEIIQVAYEPKHIPIGKVMWVLEEHIYSDPQFVEPGNLEEFVSETKKALEERAEDEYINFLKELPKEFSELDAIHVLELVQKVVKWTGKISKRFKQPILGKIDPPVILIQVVFPKVAEDTRDLFVEVLNVAKHRDEEVSVEDGFELYKEIAEARRIYNEAIPDGEWPVKLEELFADFVWRYIKTLETKVIEWVDEAIRHDDFLLKEREDGSDPPDDERHSSSVVDIFRSFNQCAEVIRKLDWQDDLTMARFMTAFSKTLVLGIMRYCETLDKVFAQEMERQTPEQEAAAKQTRQEKWLSLAKEAWSNKEKMEPFQFAPESCVKLNDIELAILQLDKMENAIEVDKWAQILHAYQATQPLKPRRQSTFVFTIKIVEAEDLKPMDLSGYSDPYVVLGDEFQKRLAKTRVIYANLNPRWEETVDITTQGPIWLTATVWDWDQMGDHDCVGRTSIKLDPAHFGDYLPRDYWLDLDTQGRLLLRVSMEGERDDIEFYFAKGFRTLRRTERDMTRLITDKLSAYIHHCLSRQALKNVLNKGITISSVSNLFSRTGFSSASKTPQPPASEDDIAAALTPLTNYFNENFAILNQTLTITAMIMVMTRLWKEVLVTIEALLVPTLSDKPSPQKQLSQTEVDVVFRWLQIMFDFFHAKDEHTGIVSGVPLDILKSPKFHEVQSLNFFYFDSTENLIRTSERIANVTSKKQSDETARLKSSSGVTPSTANKLSIGSGVRRSKSILNSRNLGTMRKVKAERWKESQMEPSDDMILRILRMRPEAATYLRERSRQKERLAAAAAAELIVRQSMGTVPTRLGGFNGANVRRAGIGRISE